MYKYQNEKKRQKCLEACVKFGDLQDLDNWINSMRLVSIVTEEMIEQIMKYDRPIAAEKNNENMLGLKIMRSGMSSALDKRQVEQNYKSLSLNMGFATFSKNLIEIMDAYSSDKQYLKEDFYIMYKNFANQRIDISKESAEGSRLEINCLKSLYGDAKAGERDEAGGKRPAAKIDWRVREEEGSLLQRYLWQIEHNEGEFTKFVNEIRKRLAEPQQFKFEKLRQSFTPEYQQLWSQVDQVIVLTLLYHSGLVHQDLIQHKQHVLEHGKIFQEIRNMIINKMLSMV